MLEASNLVLDLNVAAPEIARADPGLTPKAGWDGQAGAARGPGLIGGALLIGPGCEHQADALVLGQDIPSQARVAVWWLASPRQNEAKLNEGGTRAGETSESEVRRGKRIQDQPPALQQGLLHRPSRVLVQGGADAADARAHQDPG